MDLHDPRFLDGLKRAFGDQAPDGYPIWLDRNLAHYDPVFRAWRLRDTLPFDPCSQQSHKCWDDKCMHYIYGYPNEDDRDQHAKEHVSPTKRDSALSVGSTPSLSFPSHSGTNRTYSGDYSKQTSPLYLPRPGPDFRLARLSTSSQPKDQRDSLKSYSFATEPPVAGPRGSVDSEVDPLLPPLKRSRVGQSRLESIGELKLLGDIGPCLRCRTFNRNVR